MERNDILLLLITGKMLCSASRFSNSVTPALNKTRRAIHSKDSSPVGWGGGGAEELEQDVEGLRHGTSSVA
jgi:hypothetical protein